MTDSMIENSDTKEEYKKLNTLIYFIKPYN